MTSTDDRKDEQNEQQNEQEPAASEEEPTADEHGEHVTVIPNDKSEHGGSMHVLTGRDIDRDEQQRTKSPGLDRHALEIMTTDDGKPFYKDIVTDPETGEVISAKLTDEGRAYFEQFNKKMAEVAAQVMQPINEALGGAINDVLQEVYNNTTERLKAIREAMRPLFDFMDELQELQPYIEKELQNSPEKYGGITFDQIMEHTPGKLYKLSQDRRTIFYRVMQAARSAKEAEEKARTDRDARIHKKVTYKQSGDIVTSTDKLTNTFFSLDAPLPQGMLDGQQQFIPLSYEGKGKKKEITVYYDYYFSKETLEAFGLARQFDAFDFILASVCDNELATGNDSTTLTKLFHEMGGSGSPADTQLEEIYKALQRGATTTMVLNDRDARIAWGKLDENSKYHEITTRVMPVTINAERFVVNGKLSDGNIHIDGFSPFAIISEYTGHYTTWAKEVLQLYRGRRTSRYWRVLYFLMRNIAAIRYGSRSNKILYTTLYAETGEKTTRGKQLAKDMLYRLLDTVFIPTGYVKSYREDGKHELGVLLYCTPSAAALPTKK